MYSGRDSSCSHELDFSIRKSPDHRLLASPRGLSQLATSFIAFLRLGIHTHALSSLTIKFTQHTHTSKLLRPAVLHLPVLSKRLSGRPVLFCALLCPSVFNCQRSLFLARTSSEVIPVAFDDSGFCSLQVAAFWPRLGVSIWWAWVDSNYRPHPYQGCALTN